MTEYSLIEFYDGRYGVTRETDRKGVEFLSYDGEDWLITCSEVPSSYTCVAINCKMSKRRADKLLQKVTKEAEESEVSPLTTKYKILYTHDVH